MTRSPRYLHNSTSYNEQLVRRGSGEAAATLRTSSSSVWPSLTHAMYHHHHHAMNHHAFQTAASRTIGSSGLSPLASESLQEREKNQLQHVHQREPAGASQEEREDATNSGRKSTGGLTASGNTHSTRQERTGHTGHPGHGGSVLASAISPSDSGPSNASLDNNDSNGTVFSGTPEHKGSIASRSEINYPVIGDHSSIYLSKQNRKLVRFVTVIAYIFFVSLAAIVLSFFYYFLWDPSMEGGVASDLPHDHNSASGSLLGTVMERTGRKKFGASHFPAAIAPPMPMHPDSRSLGCPCDSRGNRLPASVDASLSPDSGSDENTDNNIIAPPPAPPSATPTIGHLQQGMHSGVGSKSLSNVLPTAPSLYEMIARRPRVIPIHASFANDLTSKQFDERHFDSHGEAMTEGAEATERRMDTATTESDSVTEATR